MKKSHESNVLRSNAGFSAADDILSFCCQVRKVDSLFTKSQLIMCAGEDISFGRSIQIAVSEFSICVSMPLIDVEPLTIGE